MAEFGLVVPILLILFIGIADFSRVFAAGVAVEAATRNAAEAAANEYLANPPPSASPPCATPDPDLTCTPDATAQPYYDDLRAYAASIVCAELRDLPNTNYDTATQTCPDMPAVLVCVHDGADGGCGALASPGTGGIPPECGEFAVLPTNAQVVNDDGTKSRTVEVRTCYRFSSILQLPLFSLGDVWLQRTRHFTIPCYYVTDVECG